MRVAAAPGVRSAAERCTQTREVGLAGGRGGSEEEEVRGWLLLLVVVVGGSAHQQRQADNKNRQIAACETGRAAGGDRSPYFGYASTLCCFLRETRAAICPRLPVILLSFPSQVGLQVKLLSSPVAAMIPT